MVQISRLNILRSLSFKQQAQKSDLSSNEGLLLKQGGIDTVSFSCKKSEKFADVRAEMDKKVPDRTTTIEEKELALLYINRLLLCDDITPEMKNYWTNKKSVIEMEIQSIKNEQQSGNNETWKDVLKEFSEFTDKYWVENVLNDKNGLSNLGFSDAQEYYITVRRTMITFCDRILSCEDLPYDKREYYANLKTGFMCDLNSYATQQNNYNETHNTKTESFYDVLDEMVSNTPDRTSTISEKQLALSYIDRMLSCDDIPNAKYWENKKDIIEMEIQTITNSEETGKDKDWQQIAKEWNTTTSRYWNKRPVFNNVQERAEYYISYFRMYISYCDRMLACDNLPEDVRQEWVKMRNDAIFDLNNHLKDLKKSEQD